ncbi:MAG: hypothetical protein RXO43_02140 [Candidatus Micrarchaeota archaeon]
MAENEKYKNEDIEKIKDGEILHISRNLDVVFYKELPESFSDLLRLLRDGYYVLGMSTKVNSPEDIAKTIADAAKNNPDIQYFAPILYENPEEKGNIIRDITERLEGLKENEVPENSEEEEIGPWRGFKTVDPDNGKRV